MDINRVRLGCCRGFPGNFEGVPIDGIFFLNCILVLFIIFLALLMKLTDLCYLREKSLFSLVCV